MRSPSRRRTLATLAAIVVVLALVHFVGPAIAERSMNGVTRSRHAPSAAVAAVHAKLRVADLHADPLLWGRDLLVESDRGHVDVPRLQKGGVALQVFSIVTKSPRGLNIERNDDKSDSITALAVAQGWPPRTWHDQPARALYLAGRLRDMAARSGGALTVITSGHGLATFLEQREATPRIVGGIISMEGAQALVGDLANLGRMFDAGVRMMSPAHFFDTEISGSAHGITKGGLTSVGRAWVAEMERRRMIIDLAHASPKAIDEILALATRPMVVSHTGVRATCDNRRNLSDEQLRKIAAKGGLIGIGYWDTAVCASGADAPRAIARAIAHTIDVVGVEHVGLGSDFDGAIDAPFDASRLDELTAALVERGLDVTTVKRVMGENVLAFMTAALPPE